ncbi:MerR family transcriptional regulator [Ktedonobacteria bacterium brp13]|nr:MerR family transcriptional regulator [Ktedonobacteria bacterium brp13]
MSKVSIKALRHYDELGLLKPASVDMHSGYRYYMADQLGTLNRILALKDMGLSLAQIAGLLANDLPREQMCGILRLRQVELQEQLQEAQVQLQRIDNWFRQFERENEISPYAVIVKAVPAQQVVMAQGRAANSEALGLTLDALFDCVEAVITNQRVRCIGYGTTLYFDGEDNESELSVGACISYDGYMDEELLPDRCQLDILPEVEQMASTIHHGTFDTLTVAYDAILTWISTNGYQIIGPNREINIAYKRGGDQQHFVTEIQFPVARLTTDPKD